MSTGPNAFRDSGQCKIDGRQPEVDDVHAVPALLQPSESPNERMARERGFEGEALSLRLEGVEGVAPSPASPPIGWPDQVAPPFDLTAHLVDDRRRVVRLRLVERPLPSSRFLLLLTAAAPLLRLRNRRDELGPPPSVDQVSGGLTRFVELPMLMRVTYGELTMGRSKNGLDIRCGF